MSFLVTSRGSGIAASSVSGFQGPEVLDLLTCLSRDPRRRPNLYREVVQRWEGLEWAKPCYGDSREDIAARTGARFGPNSPLLALKTHLDF